jgi:hypothetical protein
MSELFDLQYRPKTFFRPERFEKYLLTRVKGAVLRRKLTAMLAQGRHEEVRILVDDIGWSTADQRALERVHPMFMGGHYLPDLEFGEVEIARICLQSVTSDVISIYAKTEEGVIHYRVVDEYSGDTVLGPGETTTTEPMTLGEITDFFLKAWPFMDVLQGNAEDGDVIPLEFFHVESEFYPHLDDVFRHRVILELPQPPAGDECPFCGHFNPAPAKDPCDHAIGWTWGETLVTLYGGERLESALSQLANIIASAPEGSSAQAALRSALRAEAAKSLQGKALIDVAGLSFEEALDGVATVERGEGWTTCGFLPGTGYTVYVEEPDDLEEFVEACLELVERMAPQRDRQP